MYERCDSGETIYLFNPKFVSDVHAKRRAAKRERDLELARKRREARECEKREQIQRLKVRDANEHVCAYLRHKLELEGMHLREKRVDPRDIIEEVALDHDLSLKEIIGPSRKYHICRARHEAVYRVRTERPDLSTPKIGQIFGGRDHTSILNSVKKHKMRIAAS